MEEIELHQKQLIPSAYILNSKMELELIATAMDKMIRILAYECAVRQVFPMTAQVVENRYLPSMDGVMLELVVTAKDPRLFVMSTPAVEKARGLDTESLTKYYSALILSAIYQGKTPEIPLLEYRPERKTISWKIINNGNYTSARQ